MMSFLTGCISTTRDEAVIAASGAPGAETLLDAVCGEIRDRRIEEDTELAAFLSTLPEDHPAWVAVRDMFEARDAVQICREERGP